ncbi:MAG: hypothetical protein SO182_01395 [Paludibacteraceae bacterium]|nr:hypothetical protein [Paludibacteraceae bacterium]
MLNIYSCNNAYANVFQNDFGYTDIFECVITPIDKTQHPNEQVQIRVNLLRR